MLYSIYRSVGLKPTRYNYVAVPVESGPLTASGYCWVSQTLYPKDWIDDEPDSRDKLFVPGEAVEV